MAETCGADDETSYVGEPASKLMVWFVTGSGVEELCWMTVTVEAGSAVVTVSLMPETVKVDMGALPYIVEVRVVALLQKEGSVARLVVPRSVTT